MRAKYGARGAAGVAGHWMAGVGLGACWSAAAAVVSSAVLTSAAIVMALVAEALVWPVTPVVLQLEALVFDAPSASMSTGAQVEVMLSQSLLARMLLVSVSPMMMSEMPSLSSWL